MVEDLGFLLLFVLGWFFVVVVCIGGVFECGSNIKGDA